MRVAFRRASGDDSELVIVDHEAELVVLAMALAELATAARSHPCAGPVADLAIEMLRALDDGIPPRRTGN